MIDCRNLEAEICKLNHQMIINGEYQEELKQQSHMVYLPAIDRYSTNIWDQIEKDEFRLATASPHTELLGCGIQETIKDLTSYLFTAAVYGSFTHLYITRKRFAQLLVRYNQMIGDTSLAFHALRQYLLFGDTKNFKLYMQSMWDKFYSIVASQADDLWDLTNSVPVADRDTMRIGIFASLGLYLSDSTFANAERYMLELSTKIPSSVSEDYLNALSINLERISAQSLIDVLLPIIIEKKYWVANAISRIIRQLDYSKVKQETKLELAAVLKEKLPELIQLNGSPLMIATLVNHDSFIFGFLMDIPGNGLKGLEKDYFDIICGSKDWAHLMTDEIQCAERQFAENCTEGRYVGFAHDPYATIGEIVRDHNSPEVIRLMTDDFIPHAIKVLDSNAAVQTKEPCVACLCDALISLNTQGITLPNSLVNAIAHIDIQKGTDFRNDKTRKALQIRALMAKVLCGELEADALLQWCIGFS